MHINFSVDDQEESFGGSERLLFSLSPSSSSSPHAPHEASKYTLHLMASIQSNPFSAIHNLHRLLHISHLLQIQPNSSLPAAHLNNLKKRQVFCLCAFLLRLVSLHALCVCNMCMPPLHPSLLAIVRTSVHDIVVNGGRSSHMYTYVQRFRTSNRSESQKSQRT